ncbi:MAG: purine-nucleoside phosphorylase [Desulfamplus sp.]|nr:purine-nucleoside phosphorylase [Desulfamplus sp.]MBF0258081.1 purine-nucleoside phosphorylase [Desulfamplus sp.]
MSNNQAIEKYKDLVFETADFLRTQITDLPEIAFLTGTGLAGSTDSMDVFAKLSYGDIPNFPVSTVESHRGELIFGTLCNRKIMVMQGRFHLYEGYSPLEVTFPIRVMQEIGVKYLIISNASGGLNSMFKAGDVMIIRDHINLTGENPLKGPNIDGWGIRFPDMTEVYDKNLASIASDIARTAKLPVQHGVYAGLLGPSLETPAETRFLKTIGADAVGFSTVMEAIAAVHARMKILGLATITNLNNPDAPEKATVEEIIAVAQQSAHHVHSILKGVLEKI